MFECLKIFTFLNESYGVNRNGEKYVALEVRDTETNKNYSFISKDFDLIDKIPKMHLKNFQEIKLKIAFSRVFNTNTRFSHWQPELTDVVPSVVGGANNGR